MKKVCILLITAILIWLFILVKCVDFQMWIPTDFSQAEEQLTFDPQERVLYYYSSLSADGKIAYNRILAQIRNHPDEIEIPVLSEEEFQKMFQALSYDNPD